MIFKRKSQIVTSRPAITPDPQQAADLERRLAELSYQPRHGFLRDYQQVRHERPAVLNVARVGWETRES